MSFQDYHRKGRRPTDIISNLGKILGVPTPFSDGVGMTDFSFEKGCLSMRKAAEDKYFLMATFSNRFRDVDKFSAPHKGGEIIASYAHEAYMKFLDEHPDLAPELWSLHIPGTARKNRAHWWDYDGAFSYCEFELTAEEAAGVADFCKEYTPGLSHGFYVFKYDKENAVIEDYYTYEVSILPIEWAANPWTTFELIRKELEMKLTTERRAALVKLHGEDFVKQLETKGDQMLSMLQSIDAETKALNGTLKGASAEGGNAEDESPAGSTSGSTSSELAEVEEYAKAADVLKALKALHESISADFAKIVDRLTAKFEEYDEAFAELGVADTERIAAKTAATPAVLLANWTPPSVIGSQETEVPANSKLAKKGPEEAKGDFMNEFARLFEEGIKNG